MGGAGNVERSIKAGNEFVDKANKIHENKYDYSKVKYINNRTKVIIICPIHGEFEQAPTHHLRGNKCIKCSNKYKPTTEEFILSAKEIHGETYDYSKVKYLTTRSKINIVCNIHGSFLQTPYHHIHRQQGCPKCASSTTSFPEQVIFYYLNKSNLKVLNREKINGYEIDVYLPDFKIAIEYDGWYYHKDRESYDIEKTNALIKEDITVIRIRENGLNKIENSINFLRNNNDDNNELISLIKNILNIININTYDIDINRDKNDILKFVKINKIENSILYTHPEVAKQWHPTKNSDLKPENFSKGISVKAWWLCEHGHEYYSRIDNRCNGKGCSKCNGGIVSNTKNFIEKSKIKHNNFYDYSLVEYKNNTTKVEIICPIHGQFKIQPNNHLIGQGCSECGIFLRAKKKTLNKEHFLKRAKLIHGTRYDYSLVEYINCSTKVKIICKKHGVFEQQPDNHYQGKGCIKCGYERIK